jgi:hypothetical protein
MRSMRIVVIALAGCVLQAQTTTNTTCTLYPTAAYCSSTTNDNSAGYSASATATV